MGLTRGLLQGLYVLAAMIALLAAMRVWLREDRRAFFPLAMMLLASAWWALCDAVELQALTTNQKRLVSEAQYLGVTMAAPWFLLAARELVGAPMRWTITTRLLVWVVPVLTLGLAFTSRLHGLLWRQITIVDPTLGIARYDYGPGFWLFTAHAYALNAWATWILLRGVYRGDRLLDPVAPMVVAAIAVPWIGNIAYNFKLGPMVGVNWFSLGLAASGVLLMVAAGRLPPLNIAHGRASRLDT
jgi:hypothetical protein